MKIVCLFLMFILLHEAAAENTSNKYKSFRHLQENETKGVDFQIRSRHRCSGISVFAIHGGLIEPMTSEITLEIAQSNFNYYLFEGIKPKNNWDLHIASHQFDEPGAFELAQRSRLCMSIHGFADQIHRWVCLGGLNTKARRSIFQNLISAGLIEQNTENPCHNFCALDRENIVNRCTHKGVQIEISTKLRDQLRADPSLMKKFSEALRLGLIE